MLHAIIIDDELNGLRSLELLIEKYTPDVKIVAKTTNSSEGVDLINNYRPDIVFLDINMPNLNGFELLKEVEHKKFQLVFTTAHREFALKAIKENAIDYLLKPIASKDLIVTVEKAHGNLKKEESIISAIQFLNGMHTASDTKVSLPTKSATEMVSTDEIMYIEAQANKAVLVLKNKSVVKVNRSLKEYEQQLCLKKGKFIRLNNSCIINVNFATRYLAKDGGYAVMQNEKSIPISKQKKDEFLELINFHER